MSADTSPYLTRTELRELTGRCHRAAQIQQLNAMGIQHRVRADGAVIVLRSHHDAVLSGAARQQRTAAREPGLNLAAVP